MTCTECNRDVGAIYYTCYNCHKTNLCVMCIEMVGPKYYCMPCHQHVLNDIGKPHTLAKSPLANFGPCNLCGCQIGKYAWDCSRCHVKHICQKCKKRSGLCGECLYEPKPVQPQSEYRPKTQSAVPIQEEEFTTAPMWKR